MKTGTGEAAGASGDALRWCALSVIALAVLAVDQALKASVRSTFDPGEGTHLFGSYSIQHVQNFGVAGGGLQAKALPLAVLAMLAVLGLYEFLARRGHGRVSLVVGFGLLVGGGLGNLVDRARLGLVTDFIRNGPNAFNVADIAIFAGGIVVLVWLATALVRMWMHREPGTT
ncbi:MAG: signal peptidase II [Actinobacteria bacterium]|nr:signal peptidase II [Actinomycetota bacterium]